MAEQWTDERIEQEINKAARELIVYDTKLAIYVVPQVRRVALDIFADMGTALDAANATIAELQDALNGMRGIAQQRQKRVEELEMKLSICSEYADKLTQERATLTERVAELEASFDLRWDSDMRAIAMWQEAAGEELQWPNHADLCVWLMERNAYLEDKARDLTVELRAYVNAHNRTLPPGSTRTRRKGGSHE